ncbi:MAG: peptidylprolyl isomerase [Acidobacteria bacterium]|nr:peptidylprolyl isomerase [Acidobacteriota bacterium]
MSAKCPMSVCRGVLAILLIALALQPWLLGAQAPAGVPAEQEVAPEEVVLTVADQKITAAEFEKILSALPPQFQGATAQMGMSGFANQYGNLLGLALEGQKRKIDQKEEFVQMVSFERIVLLAQLTLNELIGAMTVVNPDEVQAYYTAHQGDFEQSKVRGIYVPFGRPDSPGGAEASSSSGASDPPEAESGTSLTEPEAQAKADSLRNRIQAGEDMATIAQSESDHPTSEKGGDFGFVGRNRFAPEIEDLIFSIPINQVSAPVRDRFGFFVFLVESRRVQPLEEATPLIENNLRQQRLSTTLTKLQDDYPVTLNPRYFNEPSPPPPMGFPPR